MAAEGNRSGTVWFRETDTGILIFARFSGGAPVWARSAIEMKQRDHVDIWLRTSLKVEMLEIGWGNQFGFETCDTYAGPRRIGAEDCKTWSARQQEYRKPLERLFERLWHMAPRVSGEERATTALTEALLYATNFEQEALSRLAPRAVPVLDATEGVGFSYFETVIPWDAFPPADTLSLDRIYVAIDIAHGNKLSATTAPRSAPGETPRLDALSLAKPHVSRLSGCSYPLDSDEKHGWYFPARSSTVSSSFALENQRHGYAYDPEGLSPLPVWTSYFEKPVGKTEFVCGPDLKYSANGRLFESDGYVHEDTLTFRALEGGRHVLKSGPVYGTLSPFGAGECGSCPTASLTMFILDPATGVTEAFDDTVMAGQFETDGDIQLSPDWRTITVYRMKGIEPGPAGWSFERYCLSGDEYAPCGSGPSGPPPKPRQIVFGGVQ